VDPIPWWVESYMHPVGPYVDGGSLYWLLPPCGIVLSAQRGAGIASDRTEVTAVPSLFTES